MRNCNRLYVALAVLLVTLSPSRSSAQTQYCPQYVVGQWSGVWWHWCTICPGDVSGAYVTDTRRHDVGVDCSNIVDVMYRLRTPQLARAIEALNKAKSDLADDSTLDPKVKASQLEAIEGMKKSLVAMAKTEPPKKGLAPDLVSMKQLKYISKRKSGAIPGVSVDSSDDFHRFSKDFPITDDVVIRIQDKPGTWRYFRALLIKPTAAISMGGKISSIGIGQETENTNLPPSILDGSYEDEFSDRQVILSTDAGGGTKQYWHISTMSSFKH